MICSDLFLRPFSRGVKFLVHCIVGDLQSLPNSQHPGIYDSVYIFPQVQFEAAVSLRSQSAL